MDQVELKEKLGPLAVLVGVWEGDEGEDWAPAGNRQSRKTRYRERITFETMSPIQNHEQNLHVLRYATRVTTLNSSDPFHEELGYWSWEPSTQEVMRCFLIPRGIALIAGGRAQRNDTEFHLHAKSGSCTFGICVNPFLDREFKIESYEATIKILDSDHFNYEQDTVIKIPGQPELFHHRDRNVLTRV